MPRHLVLSNGNLLVGLDDRATVRDLYFDRVGQENHAGGHPQKVGLSVDGHTWWLDDPSWQVVTDYLPETLVGKITAENNQAQLRVVFEDCIYNESNIFIRKVTVENLADRDRDVDIFFYNDLEVGGYTYGVTALYFPSRHALIHYRGARMFLFSGRFDNAPLHSYSVGMTRYQGLEGTWRDADDDKLSFNPIEHGRVDSAAAFRVSLKAKGQSTGWYWMAAGHSLAEIIALDDDIVARTPEHLNKSTRDFWKAWVNKQAFTFYGMTKEQVRLFKTSLLVMRAHTDNGGGIIASSDADMNLFAKDNYCYVWPRDAAFAALTFAKAGYWDLARRLFEFAVAHINEDGYLMHKYLTDGSLGSSWHPWVEEGRDVLPIQEDETAILLHALWVYYDTSRDIEFVEGIYNKFIKRAADFLVKYRHEKTGLPLHSYDLWEEHRAVSTYTASCVYGGLAAAGKFAHLLGKEEERRHYEQTAESVRTAIFQHLVDREKPRVLKHVKFDEFGEQRADERADASSFYGLIFFGVLDPEDAAAVQCSQKCDEPIMNRGAIGGVCRYENDNYFWQRDANMPNPWLITTLWHAEYLITRAKEEKDLKPAKDILQWVCERRTSAGLLPEQVHPVTGAYLSALPLVWSHAAYIHAVIMYLEKLEKLGVCRACYPLG